MEQNHEQRAGESRLRRTQRLPEDWRLLIEAQASSGLGVEEYCRQQHLTPSCFYRWRRFLTGKTGAGSPWSNPKRRRLRTIDGFAAVQVVEGKSEPRSLPGESIRLLLAGGRELILPVSMPARRLAKLLMALESKQGERSI
jgi:hypothetical protein